MHPDSMIHPHKSFQHLALITGDLVRTLLANPIKVAVATALAAASSGAFADAPDDSSGGISSVVVSAQRDRKSVV